MLALLSKLLSESSENTLWIADENSKPLLQNGFSFHGTLLSNRWDIAQLAASYGIESEFNDFDISAPGKTFTSIVYPVSKEKAVVNHLINSAAEHLAKGGRLLLLGEKNSGIKTYAKTAAQHFGCSKTLQKHGNAYLSIVQKVNGEADEPLDDSRYSELQQPEALGGLYSKPGQFGWNKIDTGSALLARHFATHLPREAAEIVDLGCGYGYLSSQAAALGSVAITATDNNAAALLACAKNFEVLGIRGGVVAGDAGSEVPSGSADVVICNPPFHQGFQVEGDLTDRFLQQAARILKKNGRALFVVNEFIPIARKAKGLFANITCIEKTQGFCIYLLHKS